MVPAAVALLPFVAAVSSGHNLLEASCSTELDCELSGDCMQGSCVCDAGWTGAHCTHLALVPNAPAHYAFHARSPGNSSF